jgi:copper resistance protein C
MILPRPLAVLSLFAFLASLLALTASPAAAHARLTGSTPAAGSVVDEVPNSVTLEFNEPVEAEFGQLQVSGPDGARLDETPPTAEGTTVTSEIGTATSAGMHTIAFRVISADGHPVEGELTYEVSEAAAAAAQQDAAPAEEPEPAEPTEPVPAETSAPEPTEDTADLSDTEETAAASGGGAPILPVALVALLGLVVAGALFARRRSDDPAEPSNG